LKHEKTSQVNKKNKKLSKHKHMGKKKTFCL